MPSPTTTDNLAEHVQHHIGPTPYRMWFEQASLTMREGVLSVQVPSRFEAEWIERRFLDQLRTAARSVGGDGAAVSFCAESIDPGTPTPSPDHDPSAERTGSDRDEASPPRARRQLLDLNDFVVGSSNQLAWTAARNLIDDPNGHHFSPLFIHGDCGVGKTHLLQGLCHRFQVQNPGSAMRYMTGEAFTNQFIQAVRHNQLERYRRTMRRLELLAIDDVHFIAGKTRTQEEVLHTIDAMALTGARIVLASDAHPSVIRRFNSSLASRCTCGLLVQVDMPEQALRLAMVQRICDDRRVTIEPSASEMIAIQCRSGAREIQGLLARIAAVRTVRSASGPITGLDVREAAGLEQPRHHRPITPQTLVEATCSIMGISTEELRGTGRPKRVVAARGLIAVLARDLTSASYPEIAIAMGRKTHSSVHAGAQRMRQNLGDDKEVSIDGSMVPLSRLRTQIQAAATSHRPSTPSR
ncbi:MAG: ATP-binding protein [Planctomycetes bacterium]|nr:ATP-binding protein [Planctomycetota bacterium]MCP4837789.1 ATP-binding protein [Planctomycetota bacterium]